MGGPAEIMSSQNDARAINMTEYDSRPAVDDSAMRLSKINVKSSDRVVQQLSSRVIYLQTIFKSIDLLHHYAKTKDRLKIAFQTFRLNV